MAITSEAGRKFIEQFEGLVLRASDDGFGNPTVGYGHTTPAGPPAVVIGMEITKGEADEILARDLDSVEHDINTWVRVPLTQSQFDALVSLTFNVGGGNIHSSTLLRLLNNKDYNGAADQFLKWNHANGRVVAGLTRRRVAERAMFLSVSETRPQPSDQGTAITLAQMLHIFTTYLKGLFNVGSSK